MREVGVIVQAVYDKLVSVARTQGLISYTEQGVVADFDVADRAHLDKLVKILDEIALGELRAGRPLLPVVVIRADTQMPSKGLFKFAKKHGVMKDADEIGFFSKELARVYAEWVGEPSR